MATNGRDHVGRFTSGHPGGPGRPRNGVRAALARIVDFDEIARYVYEVATDPDADARDRQWAVGFIVDRLEGRPVQSVSMTAQLAPAGLPPEWASMSPAERVEYLDRVRAGALGLPSGGGE